MTTGQEFRLTAIDSLEEIDRAVAKVHAHRGEDLAIFATALDKRRGAMLRFCSCCSPGRD